MITVSQYISTLLLYFVLCFVFGMLSITFSSKIYNNGILSKGKKIIISIVGAAIASYLCVSATIELFYIILYILFLLAYLFLMGKKEKNTAIFLTNAYLLNIMTLRMIVTCIIALMKNQSLNTIAYTEWNMTVLSLGITMIVLCAFLVLMITIVPGYMVYQITRHRELRRGMNIFMGLSNVYLLMQSIDYGYSNNIGFILFRNLISICILILVANWLFLIYNIKILKLLDIELENQQMHTEMEKLSVVAATDGLTGISNKIAASESIEKKLKNGGAFFVIDVDDFKEVNDTFGHKEGDILLTEIVDIIKESFRENDVIGRFGGDEFIVFMQNRFLTKEILERKADEVVQKSKVTRALSDGTVLTSTISVGGLLIPFETNISFDQAFQLADEALYQSKKNGKNSYTVCSYSRAV